MWGAHRESLVEDLKLATSQLPAMPPIARKSRSRKFAELEEKPAKGTIILYSKQRYTANSITDFDIENEAPDDDDESGSDESVDERAGTEHYVDVG